MPVLHNQLGSLFYQKTGTGSKVVFWFHGFGQHQQVFDEILKADQLSFTHYSFDLFFHGHSKWVGNSPITRKDLHALFQQFLLEHNISNFSIVAFSIGCRFALTLTESFPDKVQNLILLAPDGLQFRFWYWLATYPAISRKVFYHIVQRPTFWYRLLTFLELTRLIDKKLLRFAQRQMDSQPKRHQVYDAWVNFRHLKSDVGRLTKLVHDYPIRLTLVAGSHDRLVPIKLVEKLKHSLPAAQLQVFDTNHNDLIRLSSQSVLAVLHNQ
jgi:pimeloyl-ACP methyl ester carboxylesterase